MTWHSSDESTGRSHVAGAWDRTGRAWARCGGKNTELTTRLWHNSHTILHKIVNKAVASKKENDTIVTTPTPSFILSGNPWWLSGLTSPQGCQRASHAICLADGFRWDPCPEGSVSSSDLVTVPSTDLAFKVTDEFILGLSVLLVHGSLVDLGCSALQQGEEEVLLWCPVLSPCSSPHMKGSSKVLTASCERVVTMQLEVPLRQWTA
jgi:hypothetical protein